MTQVMQYTTYKTEYVLSGVDKHSQSKVTCLHRLKCVSHSCQLRNYRPPGAERYLTEVGLGLGGGRGSWTLLLLEEIDHLALGHLHSKNNNAAVLAIPGSKIQFISLR